MHDEHPTPRKGRRGWRIFNLDGTHVASSYEDQYTLEELTAQYPEGYTFIPFALDRDNRS